MDHVVLHRGPLLGKIGNYTWLPKSLIACRLTSGLNLNAYFSLSEAQSATPTAGKRCKEKHFLEMSKGMHTGTNN